MFYLAKNYKFSLNYLLKLLMKYINFIKISKNYIKLNIKSVNDIYIVSKILLNHSYFRYIIITDICCIDFITKSDRFELNYNFLSLDYNSRIIISVFCDTFSLVPSLINIYKGSNWLEREIWDMYGIFFLNHNDLRRILTDYGFEGYPLRKDFPLNGYLEIRYDENRQYLIYEPLELMQNMRYYFLNNPLLKKNYII